jgi:hypothetical protein
MNKRVELSLSVSVSSPQSCTTASVLRLPVEGMCFTALYFKKAFLDQLLLSAVLTVMSSAISLSCAPATLKMTVPPRGILPHQSIGNQTRRSSNMKGKGRWRSNAWSFSSN